MTSNCVLAVGMNQLLLQVDISYFDFGFIWSFTSVRHFGPLFLSLSVRLHHTTKKGTFVLKAAHSTAV